MSGTTSRTAALATFFSLALTVPPPLAENLRVVLCSLPRAYPLSSVSLHISHRCTSDDCPDYSLILRGDGSGKYEGRKNVVLRGSRTLTIGRSEFIRILGGVYDSGILEYQIPGDKRDSITVDSNGNVLVERGDLVLLDYPELTLGFQVADCTQTIKYDPLAPRRFWLWVQDTERAAGIDRLIGHDD